jgi:anti-anti-sigma factor
MCAKVLIVDDDPDILKTLRRVLGKEGYEVFEAQDGLQAINFLNDHEVALIICDQSMPGMSGIEVMQHAQALRPNTLRILLTGTGDRDTAIQAINVARVFQYLLKPWDEADLKLKVGNAVRQYELAIENRRLQELSAEQHELIAKAYHSLQDELEIGAKIQEVLLHGRPPSDFKGLSISALTLPSHEIDGDFFDFYPVASDRLDLVIGDVMGKGVPAALAGNAVKTQLMRFAIPQDTGYILTGDGEWQAALSNPSEILEQVHQEVAQQLMELGFFVALFYCRFDMERSLVTFVDCGSVKPILVRAATGEAVLLEGNNLPIGTLLSEQYHQYRQPFEQEDLFFFYSDGITEARSAAGDLFGIDRLIGSLKEIRSLPPEEIIIHLRDEVLDFCGGRERITDDMTLIAVRVEPVTTASSPQRVQALFQSDLAQLNLVRRFVAKIANTAPKCETGWCDRVQLIVAEAFTNVVKHSYRGQGRQRVVISAEISSEGLLFEIRDQGISLDPSSFAGPDFSGDSDRGFGLLIIGQIADRVIYYPKDGLHGWNRLYLFKSFQSEEGGMEFSQEESDGVLVINLDGENLDASEAPHFKERIIDCITNCKNPRVVFNLDKLQFIDSSGLGALLSILRFVNSQNGDLRLACMANPVRTMFQIVRMHRLFEIYPTPQEAVASFRLPSRAELEP